MSATSGAFDVVPVAKIKDAQHELLKFMADKHKDVVKTLDKGDKPDEKLEKTVSEAAQKVAKSYAVTAKPKKSEKA